MLANAALVKRLLNIITCMKLYKPNVLIFCHSIVRVHSHYFYSAQFKEVWYWRRMLKLGNRSCTSKTVHLIYDVLHNDKLIKCGCFSLESELLEVYSSLTCSAE